MKDSLQITLKYSGHDVDDGTMSLEDMIPALQGFASAYGKIANFENLDVQHKLRVVGVSKGSFDILLEVWEKLGNNNGQLEALKVMGSGIAGIITIILGVIKIKKHIKKRPFTTKPVPENKSIEINNSGNARLEMPINVYNIFQSKLIDTDLSKMVASLEEGKIDSTEIQVKSEKYQDKERIDFSEKHYLCDEIIEATKTEEVKLSGKFNSLTKTTNKGFFVLNDGTRVSYKLSMERPENWYSHFIYNGLVRITCVAHMDENLKPIFLDIYDIEKLQFDLFDQTTNDNKLK